MPEEKQEESEVVEVMKLATKIDWKGMALILTALMGAGGAIWNKVELYIQNYQQRQTQQQVQTTDAAAGGAYEAIATRLDELFLKVEVLEAKMNVKVDYVPVETVPESTVPSSMGSGDSRVATTHPSASEDGASPEPIPEPDDVAAVALEAPPAIPKPEPVSKRFSRARLPEFEEVQQAARGDLEQFIKEVKAK